MTDRYSIQVITNLLKMVVGRGRVKSLADDGAVQILQLQLSAKELPNLRRLAEFGFASRPPAGSDAIAVFVAGDRNNGVVIATGNQTFRLKLENDGEAALHDAFGKSIWLKKTGGIVIEANGQDVTVNGAANVVVNAATKVTLNTPLVEMSGNLKVDGNIEAGGNILADGSIGDSVRSIEADRAIFDTHTHGGVTAGAAHTAVPDEHE